jgi:EAL domain-containing protein (putative c-di-GMP-specific phosphodiesterase class I)
MSRQLMPVMLGLLVLPAGAVIFAAYLTASGQGDVAALSATVAALGAGVFAVVMVLLMKLSRQEDWLFDQQDAIRDLHEKAGGFATRLDEVDERASQPYRKLDEIMGDIRALRDGLKSVSAPQSPPQPHAMPQAGDAAEPSSRRPGASLPWGASASDQTAQPASSAQPKKGAEHLELLLEPVIELATGTTTHYRAMLDLTDEQGHVLHHAKLMRKADQGGMRSALDTHLVKLVGPVLRRLRVRNPGIRIFVPVGLSTLNARDEGSRIAQLLERDVDVASGVVFEFDQKDLGELDDTGIDNLARLARLGATLSLTRAQASGLDLAALRQLGARYLSFPTHAADSGFGVSQPWREFVQHARAMQFQIVVADIVTPQQASAAGKFGRFGHGAFFAPPRKVRSDAGIAAINRAANAA